jgi:hypothetical protein
MKERGGHVRKEIHHGRREAKLDEKIGNEKREVEDRRKAR